MRPTSHGHVDPRIPNESYLSHAWYTAKHIYSDEHNIAVGLIKSVAKGALVGGIVGSTIFGPLSRYSTMFWKKSLYYM